ncbi:hypothetical protein ACWEFJ_18430 [Actinosynnema sp. NPDC004786]
MLDHLAAVETAVDDVETSVQRNNLRLFRNHGGPARSKIGRGYERKAPHRHLTTHDYPGTTAAMRAAGCGNTIAEDPAEVDSSHTIGSFYRTHSRH